MLTQLSLTSLSWSESTLALPAGFLKGTAPRLQVIRLSGIACPALPRIVLSTSNLVELSLSNLFPSGCISPEAIVASLAALPRLEIFAIKFRSATSPDRICSPPVTRTILPSLTFFLFLGANEYLEDLVGRIDGPRLNAIYISYSDDGHVSRQVVQLSRFIDCSVGPQLTKSNHATVYFAPGGVAFSFCHRTNDPDQDLPVIAISCKEVHWSFTTTPQVLCQFLTPLSNVVHLNLNNRIDNQVLDPRIDWLHLFHQFSSVQTLYVHRYLSGHIALVLEGITAEMVAVVLPSLELIFLEDQPSSSIEKFDSARRVSGRPITVVHSEEEFDKRLEAYFSN